MATRANVHLIRKSDVSQHHCSASDFNLESLDALEDNCIRIRSAIVSLSANNLSYAHGGTILHWWDAYPTPGTTEASGYGIVPVWGYAVVLESKIPDLQTGCLIWGFWPSHDLPVVLKLREDNMSGHWIEVSDHRSKMMELYNRYLAMPVDLRLENLSQSNLDQLAWHAVVSPVGGAGWTISRFIFGDPAIHPMARDNWSSKDADVSQAVVVSLSASGKTARMCHDSLIHDRKAGTGPLGLLAVTTSQDSDLIPKASFPTKMVPYDASSSSQTMEWITELQPQRLVIIDFGARATSLEDLTVALQRHFPLCTLTIIGVGGEAKPMLPEQLSAIRGKRAAMPQRIQMNANDIYEKAMKLLGKEQFFEQRHQSYEKFVQRGGLNSMRLEWGHGIAGPGGLEGGWQRLCDQQVAPGVAMAFRI